MYTGTRLIQKNTTTAKYRRIPLDIREDTAASAQWTGSVTGVKANLSYNGAASVPSTNDIFTPGGSSHFVELTQAESNVELGVIVAQVPANVGRRMTLGFAEVVDYDPYSPSAAAGVVWDEPRSAHVTPGTFGEGVITIAIPDNLITAAKLAANAIGDPQLSVAAISKIVAGVMNAGFGANYSNLTFSDLTKVMVSVLAGVASGLDTTTAQFQNLAGTAVVVSATVDANGNRSVVLKSP